MIYVVTGPPCAGKSTFVRENRSRGSVVVDYDTLAVALGADGDHMCDGDVRAATMAARNAVIRACHKYREAWVINSNLSGHDRDEFIGAVFYDLDPGIDECVRRAQADGRPNGTISAIHDWYARNAGRSTDIKATRGQGGSHVTASRDWGA